MKPEPKPRIARSARAKVGKLQNAQLFKLVAVNERGARIGQDHPCAKLSDQDVNLIFDLRGSGWAVARIAAKMEVTPRQVRYILTGEARASRAARFKRVLIIRRARYGKRGRAKPHRGN